MPRTIAYDPSREALIHPERGASPFRAGREYTEDQLCAEFSRLAYQGFERNPEARARLLALLGQVGFPEVSFISMEGTDAFIATGPGRGVTILAFRGTEQSVRDFVTDSRFNLVRFGSRGKVHSGFASALAPVRGELERTLAGVTGRLVYTGHSLGAALATLCVDLRRPDRLVTFGSPRVGNGEFVRSLEGLSFSRHVNCADIVSRVPLEVQAYRHLAPAVYIDRMGTIRGSLDPGAIREDRKRAGRDYFRSYFWQKGSVWTRGFADHAPINYVSALLGLPAADSQPEA